LDQRAADALAPVRLRHDHHRNVSIAHAVAKGTKEAYDLATFDRY